MKRITLHTPSGMAFEVMPENIHEIRPTQGMGAPATAHAVLLIDGQMQAVRETPAEIDKLLDGA